MTPDPNATSEETQEQQLLSQLALSFASEADREIFAREPTQPNFYLYDTLPTHTSGWVGLQDVYWIRYGEVPRPFIYRGTKIHRKSRTDRPVEIRRRNAVAGFAQFPNQEIFDQRMIEESAYHDLATLDERCRQDVERLGEQGAGGPVFLHILFAR